MRARRLLAEVFDVKEPALSLAAGQTSRTERFALTGVEPDAVRGQLQRALGRGPGRASADRHRPDARSSRA